MAARRFLKSSIDWAGFAERIPPNEKVKFQQFKARVDNYTKNLMSLPEKPPAIDFSLYRSRLPNQAFVNEFEKQYNAVKVPYPEDKLTHLVDAQEKELLVQLQKFTELVDLKCKVLEKEADWWKNMIPIEEMTMDDYYDYFPDSKDHLAKHPNFWPHEEEPRAVFPYIENPVLKK